MLNAVGLKNNLLKSGFIEKNKPVLLFLSKIIIAGGLLYFIISRIEFSEIILGLKTVNISLLILAFVLTGINIFLQYWKWYVVCEKILGEKNRKKILISLFQGISGGSFTPARVGEYFGRAIVFKDKSLTQVSIATVIDKFFLLAVISFFGSVTSILLLHYYYQLNIYLTIGFISGLILLSYLVIFILINQGNWKISLISKINKYEKLSNLLKKLSILKQMDKRFSVKLVLITLLFYLTIILQFGVLVAAFSNHFEVINYLWAGSLVMFAKSIVPPVAIADLGVREGASVFFVRIFGEIGVVGFNASIFLFLINILLPSLIGILFLFKKRQ